MGLNSQYEFNKGLFLNAQALSMDKKSKINRIYSIVIRNKYKWI